MQLLTDLLLDVVFWGVAVACFVTGELLLKALTLGRHRVRWSEIRDHRLSWSPALLGAGSYAALGALVYVLV